MPDLDPSFLALPLAELSDAALSRAEALGCSHAEVRVERLQELAADLIAPDPGDASLPAFNPRQLQPQLVVRR